MVQVIFAGPVCNKQRAHELCGTVILQGTLSCPAGNSPCAAPSVDFLVCVAEWYLTLRICGYMAHEVRPCGRKDPLPFLYSLSSANFAVLNRKKDDSQEGGNLGSLLLVPLPGRQDPFASQAAISRSTKIEKRMILFTQRTNTGGILAVS